MRAYYGRQGKESSRRNAAKSLWHDLKSRAYSQKRLRDVALAMQADTDGGVDRASPRLHRNRRSNRMRRVGRSGLDSAR